MIMWHWQVFDMCDGVPCQKTNLYYTLHTTAIYISIVVISMLIIHRSSYLFQHAKPMSCIVIQIERQAKLMTTVHSPPNKNRVLII